MAFADEVSEEGELVGSAMELKKIEYDLMKALPKEHWILWNIQLITLGREICKAPTPKCEECFLTEYCEDYRKRSRMQSKKRAKG